jgi:hypothetical protein
MRAIAHNRVVFLRIGLLIFVAAPLFSAEPQDAIAQLASALSQNDSVNALAVFDSKMPGYSAIESNIGALVSQADIVCAIDVLEEKEEGTAKVLDVDWYMDVKSQAPSGPVQRRRERVSLRMILFHGNWKITAISPAKILEPLPIR